MKTESLGTMIITVERNGRETINKHLRTKHARLKIELQMLDLKEEGDTELQMSLSKELKYLGP